MEPPIADGFRATSAWSSLPASPVRAQRVPAFAGRWRASARVACSTRRVQLPSVSSSPSSSPSICSIRSSADAMSLTLKSRATTSARSMTGSSTDTGSAASSSAASRGLSPVCLGGDGLTSSDQLGMVCQPDGYAARRRLVRSTGPSHLTQTPASRASRLDRG